MCSLQKVIRETRTKKRTLVKECEVGALIFITYHRQNSHSARTTVELAGGSCEYLHNLRRMAAFTPLYHKVLILCRLFGH